MGKVKKKQNKICQNCGVDDSKLFGKSFRFHQICIECATARRDRDRAVAKQQKEEYNKALSRVDVYEMNTPSHKLNFIDSIGGLIAFENCFSNCFVAGVDTETRPMFKKGVSDRHPTSLLQIALRRDINSDIVEDIFLFDLLTLTQDESAVQELSRIIMSFFGSDKFVKIGQGLKLDIMQLLDGYSAIFFKNPNLFVTRNVLEISHLHDIFTENEVKKTTVSLQRMVFYHLNKKLNKSKSLTLSNWNARPLSERQVQYAACDALVLLHLYDHLLTTHSVAAGGVLSESIPLQLLKSHEFDESIFINENKKASRRESASSSPGNDKPLRKRNLEKTSSVNRTTRDYSSPKDSKKRKSESSRSKAFWNKKKWQKNNKSRIDGAV